MEKENNQESFPSAELQKSLRAYAPVTFREKPKQIRTTIRLSKAGHDAIERISDVKKIKNAEVLKLVLDVAAVLKNAKSFTFTSDIGDETIRKTYVISRDTFSQLTEIAKELKTSRDVLIDKTARLLDFLLDKELQERVDKYSRFFEKVKALWDEADNMRTELSKEVEQNDPVLDDLTAMCSAIEHHILSMEDYIYKKTSLKKE